jgi:hypothetical protein
VIVRAATNAPIGKTAKQVLNEAADHIERNGKSVGTYFHDPGRNPIDWAPRRIEWANVPMCALGAISYKTNGRPVQGIYVDIVELEAIGALTLQIGINTTTAPDARDVVANWSDRNSVTTVVDGLREAAAQL